MYPRNINILVSLALSIVCFYKDVEVEQSIESQTGKWRCFCSWRL